MRAETNHTIIQSNIATRQNERQPDMRISSCNVEEIKTKEKHSHYYKEPETKHNSIT